MRSAPELVPLSGTDLEGHLWLQELVVGERLRFGLDEHGRLSFATSDGPLSEPPPSLRSTLRFVREQFDRAALRDAAAEPAAVTFVGVATRFEGVPYDFERLPPLLATDVHDGDGWLPPDRVEQVTERLGLPVVNTVEKEVEAAHFDPESYGVPDSAWYDGPAAGLVVRTKTGDAAVRRNEAADEGVEPLPAVPTAAAAAAVTARRVRRAAAMAPAEDPDFEAVFERVLELVHREEHARLPEELDGREFRSAVADRIEELG